MGKSWTEEEVVFLKRAWSVVPSNVIARILDRPVDSVKAKARKLKLEARKSRPKYIPYEKIALEIWDQVKKEFREKKEQFYL